MTRIAILADIHGNLPALEAVLDDIRHYTTPDQVIVDGDIVNRGPQSRECLAAVRATGWPVLFGNHEEYILKFRAGDVPPEWYGDWWLPTRRVAEQLSDEELDYLDGLPWFHIVDVPGLPAIRVLHGSMRALNEGLGFWMDDMDLLGAVAAAPEPVIVGAHTHRPFYRQTRGRWILNCGAVVAPFNGNPAAQYLLLTGRGGVWEAEFRAIPYDRAPVYAAWERGDELQRSMIAQIFKYEVETATYHLAAYMRFCEIKELDLNAPTSFQLYRAATASTVPGRAVRYHAGT